jgi:hypothetical protein
MYGSRTLSALAARGGAHSPTVLHWLHLEPLTHLLYYTGCTWSPLTYCTTLSARGGAHSPTVLHWLYLEPTHLLYYTGCTRWRPLTYCTTLTALGAHTPHYTGCTRWRPLTYCTTLAALGAHSPTVLHWLHAVAPTHLLYYTGCTRWRPLTYCTTLAALGAQRSPVQTTGCIPPRHHGRSCSSHPRGHWGTHDSRRRYLPCMSTITASVWVPLLLVYEYRYC